MPIARSKVDGSLWITDEQGNPVAPYGGGPQVVTLPPSPKDVQTQRHQEAMDERGLRSQDRADTAAEVANRLKEQEIKLAQQKEQREGYTAKDIAGLRSNLQNIGLLEERLAKLRKLYDEHFKGKGLQSIAESYAPTGLAPAYGVFNDTAMQMLADMAKAKGLTSQQFNTPAEQRMFFEPLIPKRGDTDEQIVNKLDYLEKMVATGRRTTEMNLGIQHQKADNEVPQANGADNKPSPTDPSPPELPPENGPDASIATGVRKSVFDPRTTSQINSLISAGASKAMVDEVLKRHNKAPVSPSEWAAISKWRSLNPGKAYTGAAISNEDNLTGFQQFAGSPTGSFLANMGDMGTAGMVGLLSGEKGRGALKAMSQLNPKASLAGGLLGGALGAAGMEAGAGGILGSRLAGLAPRIADTSYGTATGFNQAEEGQGGMGALTGGAAGLGGGLLGSGLMKGAGAIARGVTDPAVQALSQRGIPLTVGQAVGNGGWLGRGVKGVEDALTSVPFVGNVIDARRREGIQAFADKMANDALAPIGGSTRGFGPQTAEDLLQQGSDAYTRATAGAHVSLDPQFSTDIAQTQALGSLLPDDLSSKLKLALSNRVNPILKDTYMTGDTFQQGVRGLKGYRAETPKPGFEQDYRNALSTGIDALRNQMIRGGGQDVVDNLAKADQAWKGIKIFQKATKAARNGARSGEVGLPMPSQFNDAATAAAEKFGGPRFNGPLIDAAQSVLPSKLPDSGTWKRLLVGGTATGTLGGVGALTGGTEGAGYGTGSGLLLAAALAAGGSKPAQKALTKILISRPAAARQFGDILSQYLAPATGAIGAGAAPLAVGY